MTEQEAFEAWLLSEGYTRERMIRCGNIYYNDHIDDLWDGWKARAAHAAILQAATREAQIPTAEQIYAELKGVAVTRTSPENICDVLAVIKRLHIAASAPKGDGND